MQKYPVNVEKENTVVNSIAYHIEGSLGVSAEKQAPKAKDSSHNGAESVAGNGFGLGNHGGNPDVKPHPVLASSTQQQGKSPDNANGSTLPHENTADKTQREIQNAPQLQKQPQNQARPTPQPSSAPTPKPL